MNQTKMFQIIDCEPKAGEVTKEEMLESYVMFFKLLGVDVKNSDGTYKSIKNIFQEAHNNIFETKIDFLLKGE